LETSSLDQQQRDDIEMETSVMTPQRASEVIANLKANQLDRLTSGMNYNQGDIKNHMAKVK
jgi:hypothetical protein